METMTDLEPRIVYAEVWDDPLDNGSYERPLSDFGYSLETHQGERSRYAEECKTRSAPWVFRCEGEVCQCFSWRDYSIWLQPRFVGMQVAMEAAAAYYRIMPVVNPRSLQHLRNYLVNDQFHLGVRPVDHVRRIYLTITPSVMARQSPNRGPTSTDYLLRPSTPLHVLREIPVKTSLHLVLRMYWCLGDTGAYLEALRPVVGELKDAGARVQVLTPIRLRDYFTGRAGVEFDGKKHFDTSDYYDLPLEEWKVVWENISEAELVKRKDVTDAKFVAMKARRRRTIEIFGWEGMNRLESGDEVRSCDVCRRPKNRRPGLMEAPLNPFKKVI
jgi:hypothetical protein